LPRAKRVRSKAVSRRSSEIQALSARDRSTPGASQDRRPAEMTPNPSIERTRPGKPDRASHVKLQGHPICQAKPSHDESRSDSSMGQARQRTVGVIGFALSIEQGADWQNYTRSLPAALSLQTLMQDARGSVIR